MLLAMHPEIAVRDCDHCQKFMYDEQRGGELTMFRGEPMKRRGPVPCRTDAGCPKGSPEHPKTLSPRNMAAFAHYHECAATGQFPDDEMVRHNAGLISAIEKQLERHAARRFDV